MFHPKYYACLKLAVAILFITAQLPCKAASPKVRFAYDVDFELNFDNREFYRSNFSESMTIFGARLTPSIGIDLRSKDGTSHRIMAGIDIMKNFGQSPVRTSIAGADSDEAASRKDNLDLFREITIRYRLEKSFGKTSMTLDAGIFPRRFMEGSYSTAFFSDSLRFYDNNIEGILLKFKLPRARYEIGCDWMGMIESSRRERFMIFLSGEGSVTKWLSLGYAGYMYHFANSEQVRGVVDNILLNPYLEADFACMTPLQSLAIRAGWLQAAQNDRMNIGKYTFPHGFEICTDIRKWNAGIRNTFFCGTDMMPYYNRADAGGLKYGNILYLGDPFYRVHDDGSKGWGIYDRLEAYYEPKIGKFLSIRVSALFHFNKGYSGCQQIVGLHFNLEELLRKH